MKFSTYLFDFDYTLVNSEKGIVDCFRHIFEKYNHTGISDEVIRRTIGMTLQDAFTSMTGITDADTLELYRRDYVKKSDEIMNPNTKFYPDSIEAMRRLKESGCVTGIISTKYRYRIQAFLTDTDTEDLFDIIVGGDDVCNAKPDPQGINQAVSRLGCSKSDTVYIGDNIIDAMAAHNAGVNFIAVTTGTNTAEEFSLYDCVSIMTCLSELI
ncbi:MAG: HAD-IA family hydrolase [Oscillospiraceae bacterium]|nr:HAD-IA family hydrolase [Oscillospiraceae bacterium]